MQPEDCHRQGKRINEANSAAPLAQSQQPPVEGDAPQRGTSSWFWSLDSRLGGAVEFQDGVGSNLPDPLGDCRLLGADGEFALVFVAAEFALDGDMRAFGKGPGKIG